MTISKTNPDPPDPKDIIAAELAKLRQVKEADAPPGYGKICIYGDPGVGKTTLAAQCGKKILHLRVDPGYTVLDRHPEFKSNIYVPMAFERLEQIEAVVYAFDHNIEPYSECDLIVIDTFAETQDQDIGTIVKVMKFRENKRPHPQLPGWDDYNLSKRRMSPLIDNLTRLPVHVIYICHVREPTEDDKKHGLIQRRMDLTNSVYLKLARYCNLIGYMTRSNSGSRKLQVTSSERVVAKTQIRGIDGTFDADKFPAMLADWTSSK